MSPEEETVINRNTMKLQEHLYKALKQRDQFQSERDTYFEDIEKLHEKNKELEHEIQKQLELLKDFSQFTNYKLYVSPANDIYKHFRRELDKLGIK
ncbi:hypothetical protein [Staphylococcus xylosus]|uniref:hypothetical protein n=1 Tax=Staphylococcus xylosus TaxID=1288 RepID=UPI000D1D17A6|nr:hypothetical protein [Staphylococcus xylosus]PTI64194.1 hypothetical protein BU095_06250 [Staphylococcus xylosus]